MISFDEARQQILSAALPLPAVRQQVMSALGFVLENPTPFQSRRDEQLKRIAAHFGGQARTSSGAAAAEAPQMVAMPNLQMPAAGAAPAGAPKKKKKEGC